MGIENIKNGPGEVLENEETPSFEESVTIFNNMVLELKENYNLDDFRSMTAEGADLSESRKLVKNSLIRVSGQFKVIEDLLDENSSPDEYLMYTQSSDDIEEVSSSVGMTVKEILLICEKKAITQENWEQVESEESLLPCEPQIEIFKEIVERFEDEHDIEVLFALETKEEALENEVRESAKQSLKEVLTQLRVLETQTDIDDERYHEIQKSYIKFSQAVGMVNNGLVDHKRLQNPPYKFFY